MQNQSVFSYLYVFKSKKKAVKKISLICLAAYFLLGQMLLPNSDFAVLPNLSAMYAHCQATEDKDLTVFDFITDHLINIDGVFDAHDNGDEQKPHKPFNFTHLFNPLSLILQHFDPQLIRTILFFSVADKDILPSSRQCFYQTNYCHSIFTRLFLFDFFC